jgi:hypothetical protein
MALAPGHKRVHLAPLVVIEQVGCQRLSPQWHQAYARVEQIVRRVVRASSAVEGMHSVLRMQQARPRHVSQARRDLKRRYWHGRALRHGKRTGHCPYEWLGLKLPTSHWWTLRQMAPKE